MLGPHPELSVPADLYLEGDDQYQCWFQTSLWVAMALGQPAPYKTVVGHGFFVDETGSKLSKSKGNIIAPSEIYEQYGADVLRLWFTYADFRQKMALSESILGQVADAYRRVRNTARFLLQNLGDFNPAEDSVTPGELMEIDRWALDKLQRRLVAITEAYDNWDLHIVHRDLHALCDADLSSFYFSVLKDRLYTDVADSRERRSAQTARWQILQALAKVMSPILTFTSEEIWQVMREEIDASLPESVQLTDWPEADESLMDNDLAARWDRILALRSVGLAALEQAKADDAVANPLEAHLELFVSDEARGLLEALDDELSQLFIVSSVELRGLDEYEGEVEPGTEIAAHAILAAGEKCTRCWVRSETVGRQADHPELCERCAGRVNTILAR